MSIKLFSYGTIQNAEVQIKLFGKKLDWINDSIKDYEVAKDLEIEGIIYPRLIPKKDSIVQGRVYELSPEQIAILDDYETNAYRRIDMRTRNNLDVQVYVSA